MDVLDRFATHSGPLDGPGPDSLTRAWEQVSPTVDEILPLSGRPGLYPYGRKVISISGDVEIIVMNWAGRRTCAPHDHGASFGWVNILAGDVSHTLCTLDQDDFPIPHLERTEKSGTRYFAARGMAHSMGNPSDDLTLTVHVYAPPIHNMKVYDLEKCAACVVSDDCGAWWPEDQRQILREIKFRRHESVRS